MDIKYAYCLTINDQRYDYLCETFKKYGLSCPQKYEGFINSEKKEKCCLLGHMSLVMIARFLKLPYIFIYEDDAYPRRDICDKMKYYFDNRPDNCGILIFGRNGEFGEIEKYNDYHIVKQRPFGAHAYVVFQPCYDDLIKSFEKEKIADIALKGDNFPNYKPYWTNENLFIQKNIDLNCMSQRLASRGKYFYPKENGGLGIFSTLPKNGMWD